jgi:phenylalanyl-tRNA synthetase beta chain
MKFTLSWLKDHLETDASVVEIAATLNRIGIEVEDVTDAGAALSAFRIARVVSAERHPQADKLQVLMVDAGPDYHGGQPVQVVCGAPNAEAYMYGVFAPPGTYIPGSGITIKESAIRGVESFGMMCSTRELGLGDEHDGIISLPNSNPLPVQGMPYAEYAGLNDPVFDVSITPNRPDCMGVRGIARDLAAAGLGRLYELTISHYPEPYWRWSQAREAAGEPVPRYTLDAAPPRVRIEDAAGCPTFLAQRIAGCANRESPEWLQRRLRAIGQKPISALVDVTNFFTVDLGRPLHVYDEAKLDGSLVARKAKAGETILALNGKTYTLDETMTVIADDTGVHDIGGIMGGEHSGVTETTTDVVIECAYFEPDTIARTGQKLNLTSDARQRFERGIDPRIMYDSLYMATRMMHAICGGEPSDIVEAEARAIALPQPVAYDPALAGTLGGLALPDRQQHEILDSLGFWLVDAAGEQLWLHNGTPPAPWTVAVPSWRPDIDGPADIVEEVVRIAGIDNIPSVPLPRAPGVAKPTATAEQKLERRLRRTAASRGLHEAITWSFIAEKEAAAVGGGAWTLANPISEDLKVMRPSLLPGLLLAAARNLRRGAGSVRLFELGRRYLADAEKPTLTILLTGDRNPRGWATGKAQPFTAFDAKAEAIALLEAAGAPVGNLQVMPVPGDADGGEAGEAWHPGQSATLRLGPKTVLATFGMLHPSLLKAFDLDGPTAAVEIFLDAIPAKRETGFMRTPYTPPALQAVTRDFAFLVPAALAAGDLVRAIKGADKAAIVDARLFDLFTGAGVEVGYKSLAIEVTLQPGDKSFTDAELKALADKVVAAAAKLGASLRG